MTNSESELSAHADSVSEMQKSREALAEALAYQAAITEILEVIGKSPHDSQPVFDTIVGRAVELCGAAFGFVLRYDGEIVSVAAHCNLDPDGLALLKTIWPMPPSPQSIVGRALLERRVNHIRDILDETSYPYSDLQQALGFRSIVAVPMFQSGNPIGAIAIYRQEVEPFSDRQIGLVQTFANQAAIAVENARLFGELQESLEFQTAASNMLSVISRSPSDAQPVFEAIVSSAAQLCQATFSAVARFDGEMLHLAALNNMSAGEEAAYRKVFPRVPATGFVMGRAFLAGKPAHVEDVTADLAYDPNTLSTLQQGAPYRTFLGIPIIRQGAPIGVIGLGRREVKPFTQSQINLVKTFADQAVIAIDNARAFAELQEKNRQVEEQAAELAEWNRTLETRVDEQVDQLGRMSKLTRFLSPKISDLIMSGEADDPLKTRRAEVTVVYVDLRGFTAFTETADPEEVMSVLREYHAELGRGITAHDGTIEHFAGDGAMVLFNAPMPMEDHELQAIRMTLQLRDAVGALAEGWRKRGFVLGFGAGIAGGYATIGTIGFAERLDYSAIGNVCNLAARLCGEATDGQILISPRIFVKVEDLVEAEPMGEMELKGFHRPVAVHNVAGLRGLSPAQQL
jgi:class 3 adenylate cyclase/GAF domain-containing protein